MDALGVQRAETCDHSLFFQVLPDQKHVYAFPAISHSHLPAAMVSSVEFADVNHLSAIIATLRQEALFASIVKSVLREGKKEKKRNQEAWRIELTSPKFGQMDCVLIAEDGGEAIPGKEGHF